MEACEAADAIRRAFPALDEAPVRALRHGRSHWTFAHGDCVFRFPRTPADARLLARELRLIPLLAPALPAPVPAPRWVGEWKGRPFAGHPLIEGEALRRGVLFGPGGGGVAREIGAFLTALHGFPPERAAEALDEPLPERAPDPRDWLEAVRPRVFPRLSATLRVAVDSGFSRYARERFEPPLRLVHHDFSFEGVLERRGRLAGVIGFSAADLGDPAVDFAGVLAGGGWHAVDDIVRFYDLPPGEGFQERVEFHYWTAGIRAIAHGLERGEERYVGLGRSMLAQRLREAGVLPA